MPSCALNVSVSKPRKCGRRKGTRTVSFEGTPVAICPGHRRLFTGQRSFPARLAR